MHRTVDTDYGADIDGNRGIIATFYELDESDYPEIISQITEYIQATGELPANPFTVQLIDHVDEHDVTFEINPIEYLTNEEMLHILLTLE